MPPFVYLVDRPHPLTGATIYGLRRVVDGKLEASGFDTETEAREWAAEMGYGVACTP